MVNSSTIRPINKIALLLLLSSSALAGERHLLMLGGGGEPKDRNFTDFDGSLKNLGNFVATEPGWKYSVSFNGGHSVTERILAEKFPRAESKSAFTVQTFKDQVEAYRQKILNARPGDQFLVYVDTHGGLQKDGEKTHSVSVGPTEKQLNLINLKGSTTIKLDDLQALSQLAAQKNVKLAIVDMSCHSGATQSLANANTCVISASGPQHFGYTTFSERFLNNMRAGKTLEQVFLETRKASLDIDYPMISTAESRQIVDKFYGGITPLIYAYSQNPPEDRLSPYLLELAEKGCQQPDDFSQMMKELRALKGIASQGSGLDLSRLEALVLQYRAKQKAIADELIKLGAQDLKKSETFHGEGKDGAFLGKERISYTWPELLRADFAERIDAVQRMLAKETDPKERAKMRAVIQMQQKAETRKAELLMTHSHLLDYEQQSKRLLAGLADTRKLAQAIAIEEKKLYQNLYDLLSVDQRRGDACKEFVL